MTVLGNRTWFGCIAGSIEYRLTSNANEESFLFIFLLELVCDLQKQRGNNGATEEVGKVLLKWVSIHAIIILFSSAQWVLIMMCQSL